MSHWNIRSVQAEDAAAIADIYAHYALHTTISFDEQPHSAAQKLAQMQAILEKGEYLVAEMGGQVIGYAYAKPWIERIAYAHTFESSIYLAATRDMHSCKGLGKALYQALIDKLAARGDVHVLMANLTLGNRPSEALHEALGFRKIAEFPEVGYKFSQWLGIQFYAYYFPRPQGL